MDKLSRDVLLLLKSGITGEGYPLPEDFDLSGSCKIMNRHNVLALGYRGAKLCGCDPQAPLMKKLYLAYCQSLQISEYQLAAIRKIYEALDAKKIDYMPVKGCIMKALYPEPELRMMGDADILIRVEQYDQVRRVMQELGYHPGEEVDHVVVWESNALIVELHKRLIPSENHDFFRYYGDGWKFATRCEGTHYYMSPEDEFVFIFTHMTKHYRGGGIGFRQLLDLWVLEQTYPEMDADYIVGEMQKLRLLEFYRNIQKTLAVWFGDGKEDAITEIITDYIVSNGSWGTISKYTMSDVVKNMEQRGHKGFNRLRCVARMAFPDIDGLSMRYPTIRERPMLQPIYWVRRWIDVLRTCPEKIKYRLQSAVDLSDEELTDFQKSLHAVGLDYRFDEKE